MSFREMTITLDDVLAFLHLPMGGRFYTPGYATRAEAAQTCALLLGGSASDYALKFDHVKTIGLRFGFLQELYTKALRDRRYGPATQMWLVHVVGSMLFACKSGGWYTTVHWISIVEHLDQVLEYAWGAIALPTLYDALGHASQRKTKQMCYYTSLLLAWVFEHFPPTIIQRMEVPDYTEDQPRACRRRESRTGHPELMERQVIFDEMTAEDVIWTPYEEHRDRSSAAVSVDGAYADYEPYLIPEGVPATIEGEVVGNYLDWYTTVSHSVYHPG
ncbi:protein MAIN-LIKE 1-like [Lotus japonicus]|uniref:protein MAIN-LIKE 1-like n=1 Tax=Lotus japonicus TaxID=34305 RepID=UPI00258E2E55|nr:protein MAIN-LIKE 1-like [Lotus japonicus]